MTRLRLSAIRVVRQQLGIGQATLARYLGVSRELVTQAEAARRTLPPAADHKLTASSPQAHHPAGVAARTAGLRLRQPRNGQQHQRKPARGKRVRSDAEKGKNAGGGLNAGDWICHCEEERRSNLFFYRPF